MVRMDQQHTPTSDELAAAIAAISLMLDQAKQPEAGERAGWIASARLAVQRMLPRRVHSLLPSWSTAERLRRGHQDGFTGITGL